MNTQNIDKSKKAKKATKTSTKSVKKKDVNKNIKKACKAKNKSTEIKTNLVTNEASINTTANQSPKNESKRKFTLDIIELLDGKVNKNIVFFGFLIFILAVNVLNTFILFDRGSELEVTTIVMNFTLITTLFLYWTYLMLEHRFILKSLILLILFFISYLLF